MRHLIKTTFCLIFTTLFVGVFSIAERLGCRDEGGNLVDWFYLYKLPKNYEGTQGKLHATTGMNYLYMIPSNASENWTLSEHLVNESSSIPGLTLSFIYKNQNENNLVMMYNDEPTIGPTDGSRGHTKGVVVANDISGFWLVHSVPKFPPSLEEGHYDYPATGTHYGQSFLCISFTGDQLWKVGNQLQYNEPHFYSSHVPEYLKTIYPELVRALDMKSITTAPYYHLETMQSRYGTKFLSFAKSKKFNKELYEDFVAPHYTAGDYYVETWRHGPGNIDSDCEKPSKVYNIEEIAFKSVNITFKTMNDHSKWLVSDEHNLICVGDLNRQEHQKLRGGGTVCQQTKASANYGILVKGVEKCKKSGRSLTHLISNDIQQIGEIRSGPEDQNLKA